MREKEVKPQRIYISVSRSAFSGDRSRLLITIIGSMPSCSAMVISLSASSVDGSGKAEEITANIGFKIRKRRTDKLVLSRNQLRNYTVASVARRTRSAGKARA